MTKARLTAQSRSHLDKRLKQLVTIDPANKAAGIIMCGDVGRILGKNIANDLIDRVIPLLP